LDRVSRDEIMRSFHYNRRNSSPDPGFIGVALMPLQINDGFATASQAVQVTVNAVNDPPGPIHVVDPGEGATFIPNQPMDLEAVVEDREGDLAGVEFDDDTNMVGIATNYPYRVTWTNLNVPIITSNFIQAIVPMTSSEPQFYRLQQVP
jgi:hypothetical protein